MRTLNLVTIIVGVIQLILGIVFIFIPAQFAALNGFTASPDWVNWLFAMFGARSIGYAIGMFFAAQNPQQHRVWLLTMVGIQIIDWIATLTYLTRGTIQFAQVPTAVVIPVLFVAVTGLWWLRHNNQSEVPA